MKIYIKYNFYYCSKKSEFFFVIIHMDKLLTDYKNQIEIFAGIILSLNSEIDFTNDQTTSIFKNLQNDVETSYGKLSNIINSENIHFHCNFKKILIRERSVSAPMYYNNYSEDTISESNLSVVSVAKTNPSNSSSLVTVFETPVAADDNVLNKILNQNLKTSTSNREFQNNICKQESLERKRNITIDFKQNSVTFKHLSGNYTGFTIKNINSFKDTKFCFKNALYLNNQGGLYRFHRGDDDYFLSDRGILYKLLNNNLVFGIFQETLQCWNYVK